ncbi:glucokinase regulator family protein [Penicillium malachiteum]|nr:glucokinase regulator family protein [Penicillium malachiteum]
MIESQQATAGKDMGSFSEPGTLSALKTEARNEIGQSMDSLDTQGLCEAFNREEAKVSSAVACCLPVIASLIDDLVPRLRAGGRLIYVGAGNSGRVGFMDSSEMPATFSTDENQFLTVVAGGDEAILRAKEGAEDSEADGSANLEMLRVSSDDTVVGISASGRTPFVVGALKVALKYNAITAVITNNSSSSLGKLGVTYCIPVIVGPEFIAGSTRLKSGSAAKQVLNMISSCAMVRMGKTYMGLMIDVRAKNQKLRARGRRIIREVCKILNETHRGEMNLIKLDGEFALADESLDAMIEKCGGHVKRACAAVISRLPPDCAQERLDRANGDFRLFVQNLSLSGISIPKNAPGLNTDRFFMSIDGGGTKCAVSIYLGSSVLVRAQAGACNFQSMVLEEMMAEIERAVKKAISQKPWQCRVTFKEMPNFTTVWAGIAGVHHTTHRQALIARLEHLLNVSVNTGSLILTSDSALLGACVGRDGTVETGIALIAGTGSVAGAFKRDARGEMIQFGRTGGWGALLGDQGSAFEIGKQALQALLRSIEAHQAADDYCLSELERKVLEGIGKGRKEVLYRILYSDIQPRHLIADLAKVVTELAFQANGPDLQALDILRSAARSLTQLVLPLTRPGMCGPHKSRLVLSGALLNIPQFKDLVLSELSCQRVGPFKQVLVVDDVASCAAKFLQAKYSDNNQYVN